MNFKNSFKNYLAILLGIFCIVTIRAQDSQTINELINTTNQVQMDGNRQLLLQNAKKLLQISEREKSEKGLSYGYYYRASYYYDNAKFKESIQYLQKAKQYPKYLELDKSHKARISGLLASNYLLLELYTLSLKNFQETLSIIESLPKKNIIDSLTESSTYSHMSYIYENKSMYDSMYYYLNKERNILRNINFKNAYIEKGCSCLGLGNYNLNLNKIDSAAAFYNYSLELFKDKNHPCKIESYLGLGNLYAQKKEYDTAESYYKEALKAFDGDSFPDILCNIYEKLADLYISKENPIEAKKYQTLYLDLKNQLDLRKKAERDLVLNDVMLETQKEYDDAVKKTQFYTFLTITLLIIVTVFIIYLLRKAQQRNKKAFEIAQQLKVKNSLQEKEKNKLILQVNNAFDEVRDLAKENSPEFFTRFQEVYPHFTSKMLEINPKFRVSELTFSAYIYLGFTTKEIADYTYKALKTIENNRYNLRKKLGITPELDLQVWLRNYIDTE